MSTTEQRKIQIIADGKQVNASMGQMAAATKILWNQLNKLGPAADGFAAKKKEFLEVRNNLKAVKDEVFGTETALQKITRTLGPFATGFSAIFVINKIKDFFVGNSEAAKLFEKALDSLQSITGATAEEMEFYRKEAELMGETTIFSAQQAAEAFTIIGSKKPELLQSKEALAAVTAETLTLAEAAEITLPEAAETMTLALNKFNLPASEAAMVADVLAASYRYGSVAIQETGFQLSKFGGIAANQNITLQQSAAMVQVVGKTVDESGTKIRNVLLKLASGADDTNPAVVGLQTALENLAAQQLDTAEMSEMFGTQNAEAALQMIKNRSEIEDLTEKVGEQGVALEMAAINMDNYEGDLKSLSSVTEGYKIKIGELINAGLRPLIQFLTAFLLGLKELPKFLYENRALLIGLGGALVAFNGQLIMTNAIALKNIAIQKAQVIWTNAVTLATRLFNTALKANPIGFVVGLVIALIGVFVNLYKNNEKVRASIQGLFAAAKANFQAIKDVAMKALGGLGDLLLGIFTFDGDRIKKGWDSLKNSAQEVSKSTVEAFKNAYNSELEKATDETAKKHEEEGQKIIDAELKIDEEIIDNKREATSWKEEQEREHREKMKKLREEFNKAEIESSKSLEDLKISIMEDGVDKRMAKNQLELDRELDLLAKKREEILQNEAITEDERNRLLEKYDEEARLKSEAKRIEDEEIQSEQRQKDLDQILSDLSEEESLKQEQLEQQFLSSMQRDFEKEQARLDLQKGFLERRLQILESSGKAETLQAEKLRTAILKIDKELADGKVENEEKTQKLKKELREKGFEGSKDILKAGLDLLGEETTARKVAATALKAFEIGEVVTSGIAEIQQIWKWAAKLGPFGSAVAAIQTGAAIARTAAAVGKIKSTQYAVGGSTGSSNTIDMLWDGSSFVQPNGVSTRWVGSYAGGGPINSPSLGLIGEAGNEWVAPNWMIRSPKYANLIGYLEAERVRGRAFADGGSTASAMGLPQNSSATADLQQQLAQIESFEELKSILLDMKDLLEEWPLRLKVINDPNDTIDAINVKNEIDSDSVISR